jgi:hypothetical protein
MSERLLKLLLEAELRGAAALLLSAVYGADVETSIATAGKGKQFNAWKRKFYMHRGDKRNRMSVTREKKKRSYDAADNEKRSALRADKMAQFI